MRKWFAGGLIVGGIILLAGGLFQLWGRGEEIVSPLASSLKKSLPGGNKYAPYTFEALSAREFQLGKINLTSLTKKGQNFDTYVFTYQSDGKTISGMANIPTGKGPFPVIILLRGYANQETYHIGLGTERSANFLAEHGFLTLAPDFLGYGWSDWEDKDILLARFYRPVEVLNLLWVIDSLPQADNSRIGLWGHSNGGQIALSILEITGQAYPTSLWSPVSLGFPESVTVYLGKEEEVGNPVKEKVEEFLKTNDPKKFSIAEYFTQIKAPFIVHQGLADELVKTEWTRGLVERLRDQDLSVDFYLYRGENHNFNRYKETGDLLRQRDWEFFRQYLK
ncbi:MAG TPA: prolyl oligopeptidase family serine peptidase [Patescibacteria group bacterium]|nr:prolyl oligopeptidase family serine peptidase [Patescibacteria group bacterium]